MCLWPGAGIFILRKKSLLSIPIKWLLSCCGVVWCCGVVLVVYRRVWYYKWCSDRRDQFQSSAWCCWSLISQCCVTVVISPPTFAYSQSSQLLMSCSRDISQVLTNNLKSSVKSVMRLSRVHLPTLLQTLISSQQLQTYFQNYSWLNLNE